MPRLCIAGHRHWSEHTGGVEVQTRYLGEILRAAGWEVVYLCHSLQGREGVETLAPGYTVWWIPLYPYGWAVPRGYIRGILQQIQPDVLYQRGWGPLQESGIPLQFALHHRIPYVFALSSDGTACRRFAQTHMVLFYRRPRWRSWLLLPYALWADHRMQVLIRHAPYLFAQHEGQQLCLVRRYGRTDSILVRTLHPELQRPAEKHPTPMVVWVHNYRPHAQLSVALEIAAALAPEGIEFHIVTGTTRPAQLHELRRRTPVPPTVHLHGRLPQEEAERLLERAWVLLHTGLVEGFPNTFVQAWLRETPVVSLWVDPGGVLSREGLGFCAQGNRELLQATLLQLLNSPEELRRLGQHARNYAEKRHGIQHNAAFLCRLFEGIYHRRPPEELLQG